MFEQKVENLKNTKPAYGNMRNDRSKRETLDDIL